GARFAEQLEARGVPTYFPETESLEQIDAMLLGVGSRTAHFADARTLVDALHARAAALARALEGRAKKRAILLFGRSPLVAAGRGSFADELLARAGAENVVTTGGAYPHVGIERVIEWDPDVVLDASGAGGAINKDAPGWRSVRAVREGRVVDVNDAR